ncbi:PleD family two-component system response regulator [Herpetosiphon sp. NSE202]|uniref:response regulator n=1 Tax=Herpetosiphon sp. NSE202 TaxID=3351349 RepID=UPI00362984FA
MATILVVDDEPTVRQVIGEILTDEGYRVVLVANGREGLAALTTIVMDLVLCDLMMPVMDGVAFVTALRGQERTRDMPVILMSAVPELNSLAQTSYTAFLEKPFSITSLLETVDDVFTDTTRPSDAPFTLLGNDLPDAPTPAA